MDNTEYHKLKNQILLEIYKGKGKTTARLLRRRHKMSIEKAKEVAERTPLMMWKRIVGPKGGRPTVIFWVQITEDYDPS